MASKVVIRSGSNPWGWANTQNKTCQPSSSMPPSSSLICGWRKRCHTFPCLSSSSPRQRQPSFLPSASLSSSSSSSSPKTSTKLYVSGLSFRTTEESLRNAFQNFGELVQGENSKDERTHVPSLRGAAYSVCQLFSKVNLVMDRIANRPRGFAFLIYATEEESRNAIEGMHGKFLDGRVIFVEVAKPRSELRQTPKQNPRQY